MLDVRHLALDGLLETGRSASPTIAASFPKRGMMACGARLGLLTISYKDIIGVERTGTLRGLHFQVPPAAQAKLVGCPADRHSTLQSTFGTVRQPIASGPGDPVRRRMESNC